MASPFARRLACSSSRIEFVSYGLLFHFQLLSTPHYCDAVTFSYRPGNFGRTGLSPANTVRSKAHERRSPDRHLNKCRRQAATAGCSCCNRINLLCPLLDSAELQAGITIFLRTQTALLEPAAPATTEQDARVTTGPEALHFLCTLPGKENRIKKSSCRKMVDQ